MKLLRNIKFRELLQVVLLLIVAFLVWQHLLSQQFIGEGFQYFEQGATRFRPLILPHDTFAKLFFSIIPTFFGDRVYFYMLFLLIIMLSTDVVFYILVKIITNSTLAAILSTIIFSTNFVGNYDIYSTGGYQYFVQRAILLLPQIIAFIFFVLYLNHNFPIKFYLFSLIFYLINITLGFFASFFLPIFVFYPFAYFLLKKNLKYLVLPIPFIIGNWFLVRQSGYANSGGSFLDFLSHNFYQITSGIMHQFLLISLPPGFFINSFPNFLIILVPLIYLAGVVLIIRKEPKWSIIAISALLSFISMLFLNIYINANASMNTFGSSRYFYYPYSMFALFWGIVLATLFTKAKFYLLLPFFIIFWVFNNFIVIINNLEHDKPFQQANYLTINLLRQKADSLRKDSFIFQLPSTFGPYGSTFANRFYGNPNGKFTLQGFEDIDLKKISNENFDPEGLYVLVYDSSKQKVIDKTESFRIVLRDLEGVE